MFSAVPRSAPVQLPSDRVVLTASIPTVAGSGDLWEGVLKTEGQNDQAVIIRRVRCRRAAAIARRVASLVNHHQSVRVLLGLVDVTPTESYVVMERGVKRNFMNLPRVAGLQRLRQLDLSSWQTPHSNNITDVGLASIASLHQLQHLDLSRCSTITDVGLGSIAALHELHRLDLNSCKKITDAGLSGIAGLRQLLRLELRGCLQMTDIASVASLQQLQHLDVGWSGIGDAALASIAALQRLRYVDLSYSTLTDVGLASVAALHQLQHLSLNYCVNITDVGIASITELQLLRLDLSCCNKITDVGLASVAALQHLQHLDLCGCKKITDVGLASVATLQNLQHLDVRWCINVTNNVGRCLTEASVRDFLTSVRGAWI